jgi:methanogen homocitrate synthase
MHEVREKIHAPERVLIHDSTLRDGEQTAGVVFTKEEKVKIGKALSEYGVDRIELMPVVSEDDFQAARELVDLGISAEIYGFCRAINNDIDRATQSGCKGVVIELLAYPRLLDAIPLSKEGAIDLFTNASNFARERGVRIAGFMALVTQAPVDYSLDVIEGLSKRNAFDSIVVADTNGMALPSAIYEYIRKVRNVTDKTIEIHTHNNMHMALANALSGVSAGAGVIHTCVNGIGENGGNAALEAVGITLETMMGIETRLDLKKSYELCKMVSDISGLKLPELWPLTGERVYWTEPGISIDIGIKLMNVKSEHPMFFDIPSMIGRQRQVVVGKKSGKSSIGLKMLLLGMPQADEDTRKKITEAVKKRAIEVHRHLTDDEFRSIVEEVSRSNLN